MEEKKSKPSQAEKFRGAAKEHGADLNEQDFDQVVKKVAKTKAEPAKNQEK